MQTESITVSGVTGYINGNGTAMLRLEDVARGLGFTTVATSGNECVRWNTVYNYLSEMGIATSCNGSDYRSMCPDFIPENIFYRLAFKAKNAVAEAFQSKVADEILPAIRKTGTYSVIPRDSYMIEDPVERARAWIHEFEERKALTGQIEHDHPKVLFADSVAASKTSILIGELAKIIRQNGHEIGEKRLFEWLRENGYLIKRFGTDHNMPTQKSMEMGLFEVKETSITHSDGHVTISKTTKVTGRGQQYFINKFLG